MRPFDKLRALPAQTVAAGVGGEASAVRAVLEASYDAVRQLLVRLVGPSQDLDDLQQTVLLRLVSSLPRYRPRAAFSAWVAGVCMNVVREYFRRNKTRAVTMLVPDPDAVVRHDRTAASAEQSLDERELVRQCLDALAHLSPEQRTAFVLRTAYGHSIAEIAAMTDSMRSTTRLRLYYGRKAFCRAIAADVARLDGEFTVEAEVTP
jgi:RNA polymerase sigma-70 factor, ECF subfamily